MQNHNFSAVNILQSKNKRDGFSLYLCQDVDTSGEQPAMPQVHCATGPICHRSDMPHFFHFIPQCKPVILKGWLLETVLWRSVQVCLSVFAVCQSVCLSVSLSLCLLKGLIARNLFIKIGASMSVCLCCLSVCLSICLSVCLSAYLNVLVLQPRPLGRFWYILSLENDTDYPLKFQTISHHTHMRIGHIFTI